MIKCVPLPEAEKLRKAWENQEITYELFTMPVNERIETLSKYVSADMAKFISMEASKAVAPTRADAMERLAKKMFREKDAQDNAMGSINNYKQMAEKIKENDNYFDVIKDLAEQKLGIGVTKTEFANIMKLAEEVDTHWVDSGGLAKSIVDDKDGYMKLFKAKKKLRDYANSLNPNSGVKIFINNTGKMVMMMGFSSLSLNILSNTEMLAEARLMNSLNSKMVKGNYSKFVRDFMKKNVGLFRQTGFDISRMENIEDVNKILGESYTHAQGPGFGRAIARVANRAIGHYGLGLPDVFFSSLIFANTADMQGLMEARKLQLKGQELKDKGLEIAKDATLISPKTEVGRKVREIAIENAQYYTFTNNSVYSKKASSAKKFLNDIIDESGNILIPFSKTPANVVGVQIDHTGIPLVLNAIDFLKKYTFNKGYNKYSDDKELRKLISQFLRAGLGWTLALLINQFLKPKEVIGDYNSYTKKERELIEANDGIYNSIKIRSKYISLDYLPQAGLLLTAISAFSKNKNKRLDERAFLTSLEIGRVLSKMPGISEIAGVFTNGQDILANKNDLSRIESDALRGLRSWVYARTIPAIFKQFPEAIRGQKVNWVIDKKNIFNTKYQNKYNMFGQPVRGKPMKILGLPLLFLTGARLTTANDNDFLIELNRLNQNGELPNIADIRYNNKKIRELEQYMGAKEFSNLIREVGLRFKRWGDETISSDTYKYAEDIKNDDGTIKETADEQRSKLITRTLSDAVALTKEEWIDSGKLVIKKGDR